MKKLIIMMLAISLTNGPILSMDKEKGIKIFHGNDAREVGKKLLNLKLGYVNPFSQNLKAMINDISISTDKKIENNGTIRSECYINTSSDVKRGFLYHDTERMESLIVDFNDSDICKAGVDIFPSWRISGITKIGLFSAVCIGLYALKSKWK